MRLLRIPVTALKWLLAVLAALVWITVVPIVDLLRDAVGRLWRGVSRLR
jgi:hypothetical protein